MPQRPPTPAESSLWEPVDAYLEASLGIGDPVLEAALAASDAAGLPRIQVSPTQGRFLEVLARSIAARRILEVGTLGGYSAICLGRALPPDGRLISLELVERHAEIARENLRRAGLAERVEVRVGPARESLERMRLEGSPPFDLVFLDADKPGYPEYLEATLRLSRTGTVIVVDNVVRRGDILRGPDGDPDVQGVRRMLERMGNDPRLVSTALQTVGRKGHDGFAVAVIRDPE